MWSTNKNDRCVRLSLLIINFSTCVAIVYIYVKYLGEQEKANVRISPRDFIQSEKLTDEHCIPVCESRACISHANLFLRNMNMTANPCNDFRSFLCGEFERKFGPEEASEMLAEYIDPMLSTLKGILDNLESDSGTASAKMKIMYDSCVNYGSSELQGIEDLKEFFNNLGLFNWPNLARNFNFSVINLPTILGHFLVYGGNDFINLERVAEENREVTFEISAHYMLSHLKLPQELALIMQKYFDLEPQDIESIIKDYEQIKSLLENLYEESMEVACDENCSNFRINCSRQNAADWSSLCQAIEVILNLMNVREEIGKFSITMDKQNEAFFSNLFSRLHFLSDRSIANFLTLNFMNEHHDELSFHFRLSKLKHHLFQTDRERANYHIERWRYCVRWIIDNMQLPLENEFFHQYLTNTVTEEIIDNYNQYLNDIINLVMHQEWVPTSLKMALPELMHDAEFNILLLSKVLPNDTHVNKIFKMFNPSRGHFFRNALELKRSLITRDSLIKPLNEETSYPATTTFEIQAMGTPFNLEVNYGFLLPPLFVPGHNKLMNRILSATTIGHELGHIIHMTLGISVSENIIKTANCLGEQFSRFKFDNLNEYLDGPMYSVETLADSVATALIDEIIAKYSSSQDIILPALPYSTQQLLYMSATQMWCAKSNLETDLHYKAGDFHPPPEFRSSGMMQNSKGFPKAFQCLEGSYMNPASKCLFLDTNQTLNLEE